MSERDEQTAFFRLVRQMEGEIPELSVVHAVPNGAWMKNAKMAVIAKREGLTPGVWDVFCPVPVTTFDMNEMWINGLYIEFKFGRNKLKDTQKWFGEEMFKRGYALGVAFNWKEAVNILAVYLQRPELIVGDMEELGTAEKQWRWDNIYIEIDVLMFGKVPFRFPYGGYVHVLGTSIELV